MKTSIPKMLNILSRKGCKISDSSIDISKAQDLGSKSWGYISYLRNKEGYMLLGEISYKIECHKKYKVDKESTKFKSTKETSIPPHIIATKIQNGKLYHSYQFFPKTDGGMDISEHHRLEEARNLQTKFNRKYARKTVAEKSEIKKAKKVCEYYGQVIFQSENPVPVSNKQQPKKQELKNAA